MSPVELREKAEDMGLGGTAVSNGRVEHAPRPRVVTARDYLAREREPIEPFVDTPDGRTVLLARETALLVAGPSGVGKSLTASFDLGGRLAAGTNSDWLSLRVHARRRVLLLPFEGSDEDNADRVRSLVPEDALDRFIVWDRWFGADIPRSDEGGRQLLAAWLRELAIDVLIIDTATAFFGAGFAVDQGEQAHADLQELRALSGQRFAAIVVAHTRKADRKGAQSDPLEEISGTYPRKADAAVVIRRVGEEQTDPRRSVLFPKVRRGPELRTKIATLPAGNEPPRLTVVADAGRRIKEGSGAPGMAAWIADQPEPVPAAVLRVRFNISDTTLRTRRLDEMKPLGIYRAKLPGRGNTYAYGTEDQWRAVTLGEVA